MLFASLSPNLKITLHLSMYPILHFFRFSAIHSMLYDEKSCFQPRLLLQELAVVKNSCTQGHSKLRGTRRVMALAFGVSPDSSGKSPLGETLHWGMKGFLRRRYIGVQEERTVQDSKGENAVSDNPMFMYAGEYDSVDDAKADLEVLKELHREHVVGTYDAAVLTKNEEGKVEIVDKIEKPTQHGGWAGLAVGAAIGLIFPPSILVSGLVGAGAGALIGHLRDGMSNSDLKEVGEMLDESEAGLIVVGEATIERAVEEATKRAKKEMKKEVRADAKEMERAIDTA
jgi:uncharacterized membrane protein